MQSLNLNVLSYFDCNRTSKITSTTLSTYPPTLYESTLHFSCLVGKKAARIPLDLVVIEVSVIIIG